MTLSTKLEVHNISQRRHKRAESFPQATRIKNSVKFVMGVVFELYERQTDRQTDILIAILGATVGGRCDIGKGRMWL